MLYIYRSLGLLGRICCGDAYVAGCVVIVIRPEAGKWPEILNHDPNILNHFYRRLFYRLQHFPHKLTISHGLCNKPHISQTLHFTTPSLHLPPSPRHSTHRQVSRRSIRRHLPPSRHHSLYSQVSHRSTKRRRVHFQMLGMKMKER